MDKVLLPLYLRLGMMSVIWGMGMVCGRILGELVEAPATLSAIRFAIAAIVMMVVRPWRGLPEHFNWRNRVGLITISFASAAFSYFYFLGVARVNAVGTALVIALNPVLVAVVASFIMHEHLGKWRWLGVVLSFIGGLVVVGGGNPAAVLNLDQGSVYLLGCALSWAVYSLVGKIVLAKLPVLFAVWVGMVAGAVMLFIFALFTEPMYTVLYMPASGWVSLLFIAVFVSAVSYIWYYQGIAALGASRAANFINLVPVAAAIIGWLALGEVPHQYQFVGGAIVLFGLWLVNHSGKQEVKGG